MQKCIIKWWILNKQRKMVSSWVIHNREWSSPMINNKTPHLIHLSTITFKIPLLAVYCQVAKTLLLISQINFNKVPQQINPIKNLYYLKAMVEDLMKMNKITKKKLNIMNVFHLILDIANINNKSFHQ